MIGKILKLLRKAQHLTQEEVAKNINVARSTYTYYEREEREMNFDTLVKLADFYNVSVDYMLGRTINPDFMSSQPTYSPEEIDIIKKYRTLNEIRQEAVRDLIDTSYARIKTQKNTKELIL